MIFSVKSASFYKGSKESFEIMSWEIVCWPLFVTRTCSIFWDIDVNTLNSIGHQFNQDTKECFWNKNVINNTDIKYNLIASRKTSIEYREIAMCRHAIKLWEPKISGREIEYWYMTVCRHVIICFECWGYYNMKIENSSTKLVTLNDILWKQNVSIP